jgi:hypothetical protein
MRKLRRSSLTPVLLIWLLMGQLVPGETVREADTITCTLVGRVIDQTGAPLAGVRITITNQDTGNLRTTLTNLEGRYQITFLPLGIYTIEAVKPPLVIITPANQPVKTALNKVINTAPDIVMGPSAPPAPPVRPAPPATAADEEVGQLTNQVDATRRSNTDERQAVSLPLSGIRSFDDLALLAPGVAPPPEVKGVAGPGIGAGIGTAGQFSVNGQRARANNFTVDGSDNNDEDVGVRRQGFVSLVPQSIESIKEFQIVTHLWDAEAGRNLGAQVNAVSKSGTNQIHGVLYDFFNHDALNARNFFDYTSDNSPSRNLTALQRFFNAPARVVNVKVFDPRDDPDTITGREVVQANPSEGRDPSHRHQAGFALGLPMAKKYFGPLGAARPATFFFGSFERQTLRARRETHFAVPTVTQRGLMGLGASGFCAVDAQGQCASRFRPTFVAGDAVFSLFPFPNNPVGPYGDNTFTRVLPANADGTIFSLKLDHDFTLFGPEVRHTLTGRYNFSDNRRQVPAVGNAIFSSVEPRIGAQNLSLFLNSQLTARLAHQLRGSFGRTRLRFHPLPEPLLLPSQFVTHDPMNSPFLLNRPLLFNVTNFAGYENQPGSYQTSPGTTEGNLGPVGQVIVTPFSPVGLDPYLFPQARVNNTYQLADTLTLFRGNHTLKFGADLRRTQLNSLLNRNFRPQVVFGGAPDLSRDRLFDPFFSTPQNQELNRFRGLSFTRDASGNFLSPTPGLFSGADLAALGIPAGIFQALSTGTTDTTIGLRFWQLNFFFNDNWRGRRGLTLDYGLRYEYNTVPREANRKIENTFRLDGLPAPDLSLSYRLRYPLRPDFTRPAPSLIAAFNVARDALGRFINGRAAIFDPDRNNFGPHVSFAWDPFAGHARQAGKSVVRGGAGIYYDLTLGNVVSQSRNVFPNFIPFSLDSSTFDITQLSAPPPIGLLGIFNPLFNAFTIRGAQCGLGPEGLPLCPLLTLDGRLNVIGLPPGALIPTLGVLFNSPALSGLPSGAGLAFTLPERRLRTPYALHFNLQAERELLGDFLLNVAYVGSRGVKLTRFRTPNGGLYSPQIPLDPLGLTLNRPRPERVLPALAFPPLFLNNPDPFYRPIPGLGAITIFDSSAASTYHSLQASLTKRFARGWQLTAAYTWSHAIDEVSDVFDVAGAFNLPQDDGNLRLERGHANFDLRHRFVVSTISDLPFLTRFNRARGARGLLLGGWQWAQLSTFQTGQPFTVNTSFDINLDGNLTDRLDTLNGVEITNDRRQRLKLIAPSVAALLSSTLGNGRVGRNTFWASGVMQTDLTLMKSFRLKEGQHLMLRVEAFNLFNRSQFGAPVRILEAPSFGQAVDTSLNARQIQFALKYLF